jgi:single-strand DNA-binding protein
MNIVIIMGNLGKDPEMRYTTSGAAVANFSVAINENYTNEAGEKQEKTTWINCVAWKKTAENCSQYLHKGSKVLVQGRIQVRSWDDKDTGKKRYSTEVVAERVTFLDGKKQEGDAPQAEQGAQPPSDGDAPF